MAELFSAFSTHSEMPVWPRYRIWRVADLVFLVRTRIFQREDSYRKGMMVLFFVTSCMSGCGVNPVPLPVDLITITGPQVSHRVQLPPPCTMPEMKRWPNSPAIGLNDIREIQDQIFKKIQGQLTYPPLAMQYGWDGMVDVCFTVERNGKIVQVTVARSSGNAFLDNEAVKLLRSINHIDLSEPLPWPYLTGLLPVNYGLTAARTRQHALGNIIRYRLREVTTYPEEAIPLKLEGNIFLSALLLADGHIEQVKILSSSGFDPLDQSAKRWLEEAGPFAIGEYVSETPALLLIPLAYRFDHSRR